MTTRHDGMRLGIWTIGRTMRHWRRRPMAYIKTQHGVNIVEFQSDDDWIMIVTMICTSLQLLPYADCSLSRFLWRKQLHQKWTFITRFTSIIHTQRNHEFLCYFGSMLILQPPKQIFSSKIRPPKITIPKKVIIWFLTVFCCEASQLFMIGKLREPCFTWTRTTCCWLLTNQQLNHNTVTNIFCLYSCFEGTTAQISFIEPPAIKIKQRRVHHLYLCYTVMH